MKLDDPVCLCFHVSKRKIIRYIRIERPRRASQLSNCFGAGTGCGWCRPFLKRLLAQHGEPSPAEFSGTADAEDGPILDIDEMSMEDYQAQRAEYRQRKKEDDASN